MAKTVYTIETEGFIEDGDAFKMTVTLSDDSGKPDLVSKFSGLSAIQVSGMAQAFASGLDSQEGIDEMLALTDDKGEEEAAPSA